MPRNISFALTTPQFKNKSKTVTRRKGWKFLKVGDVLMGCKKCMGLKKGEKIKYLGLIKVISVRQESLLTMSINAEYGRTELKKEGFLCEPFKIRIVNFYELFTKQGIQVTEFVTRIEFQYL